MKKKILSALLVIVILLCSMPACENVFDLFGVEASALTIAEIESRMTACKKKYPNGAVWCGTYYANDGTSGPWQCFGFACEIFRELFKCEMSRQYKDNMYELVLNKNIVQVGSTLSPGKYGATEVEKLLSQARIGYIIQAKSTTSQHTMIVNYVDANGISIYDANSDGKNGIRTDKYYTWTGFYNYRSEGISLYRYVDYPVSSHAVDSNYSKNYTTYLKNPSGETTVYSSCGVVASGHYISGDDPVTIHEVYTDGCCKVSYTTDSGVTRTYYAKISDFKPAHTHSYTKYYESAHPHREYNECSCGDWDYTGTYATVRTCSSCWDIEFESSKSSININVGNSDTLSVFISGSVYPDGGKFDWQYDKTIISVERSDNRNYVITGLKKGSTNLVFTAYTDATLSTVITSLAIPVNVSDTYKISYYANGGTNPPGAQTKTDGNDITISLNEPTRDGYTFLGWSTSSSASSPDRNYDPGDTYSANASLSLYAVWKKTFYGDIDNNGVVNNTDVTKLSAILTGSATADSLTKLKGDLNGNGEIDDADLLILSQFCSKMTDTFPVEDMFGLVSVSLEKSNYAPGETINATAFTVTYTNYKQHIVNTGFSISPTIASGSGQQQVTATLGDWTAYIYITVSEPAAYTLTYNANSGSGAPSSQTGATSYTISSTVPTRFGYTFLGWATSSSATSASYKPGNSISLSGATTLYAVWKSATTMSVGSSYTASVGFSNQEVYYSFTPSASGEYVFESTGSVDSKVEVFNSSGTSLDSDDDSSDTGFNFKLKLTLSAGTKYYIKVRAYNTDTGNISFSVKRTTYTLSYNANGGSGAPSSQTGATSYTISSTVPTRFGYTFLGWATSSSATSASYDPGDSITLSADTTLYAVWKNNTSSMSVNSSNSAQISTGGEMKYYTYTPSTSGAYVIYSTGSDDTKVYLYNASGAELDSDDDDGDSNNFRLEYNLTAGTKYVFGVRYYNSSKTGTIAFKFGKVYTVTFNANNGSGAPSSQKKDYGKSLTLNSTAPTRSGYVFKGWATSSTSTSATYQPGGTYSTESDVTLYAVWHAHSYSSTVTKAATCTTSGVRTYTCSGCSDNYTETISATGHKWTAATCTTPKTCSTCKSTEGNALGHSYTSKVTKAATCTTDGVKTFTCSACGDAYTEAVATLGHSEEAIPDVAATCTQTGLTQGKKCSVCGEVLVEQEEIPVIDHADADKNGLCDTCGEAVTVDFTLGDIDNDGNITSSDARTALRAAVELDTLTEEQTLAADVDKNGTITSSDARSILRCAVGLEALS